MPQNGTIDWSLVFGPMRGLSQESVRMFHDSHLRQDGGLLILQASFRGRDLVEAAFRTENWNLTGLRI